MADIETLKTETEQLRNKSLTAAERHYAAETPWYHANYWFGIPAIMLAGVAGAAAFAKLDPTGIVSGVISTVVAVLSGLMTFLDPSKKADTHHRFAKAYERLYHETGFFSRVALHAETTPVSDLEKQLLALTAKFMDLNTTSPAISGRAQRVARGKLAENTGEVTRDSTPPPPTPEPQK
jgi:hypothetical protein